MAINLRTHSRFVAFGVFAALAVFAQADYKIVAHQTEKSDMQGEKNKNETTTTYFKNGFLREDESSGTITITDPKAHKSYKLNAKTKTYSELAMSPEMGKMKVSTTTHVKATSQKKVIAGKSSTLYLIDMTIDMQMPGMTQTSPSMGTVHVAIKMNQWMTTAMKQKVTPADTMNAMGEMISGLGSMGADQNAMKKEFAKLRGIPLDMDVTIKGEMKWAKDAPQMPDMPKGFNMNVVSKVQSISEAPLSMNLFKIPAGYKKRTPGMRSRGMGGDE